MKKPRKSVYALMALSLSAVSSTYTPTPFDPNPSLRSVLPAHLFLVLHAVAALIYQRYLDALITDTRSKLSSYAMSVAGAGAMSIPLALFIAIIVCPQSLHLSMESNTSLF